MNEGLYFGSARNKEVLTRLLVEYKVLNDKVIIIIKVKTPYVRHEETKTFKIIMTRATAKGRHLIYIRRTKST
ncbi:hypothetical protein EYC84_004277 [Monilinia fructicola]|uniref:Uncharacterized protein n=1 Tax=Monilinia fructicola TaxID=38448 RepID=A0A5M9K3N2_MONFR|nr:hypothetical protein EYC84_004277 [Monilinia fructicola]